MPRIRIVNRRKLIRQAKSMARRFKKYGNYTSPAEARIRRVVKKVERSSQETKYAANNVTDNRALGQIGATPADFVPLTTLVQRGTADNQRIGDSIRPVVCKAHWSFYFDTSTTNNQDVLVNFWIVRSKMAKSPQSIANLTGGNFLKLGTGVNVDPINPSQPSMLTLVSKYPLNKDAYTLLYHKNFRMRKGFGNAAGTSTAGYIAPTGTPASEDLHEITFSWKPTVWNFDDTNPAPYTNLPVNDCPVALIWLTNADGSGGTHNVVYGLRTEVFYKDA